MITQTKSLKQDIIDQIYWDTRVSVSDLKVFAQEDGTILIEGVVPNYPMRVTILEDIWVIPGVTSVIDHLSISYPSDTSLPIDSIIQKNIEASLTWQPNIDAARILVHTKERWVYLQGYQSAYWKRLVAERVATDMVGVQGVSNMIQVIPFNHVSDETIATTISNALRRNVMIPLDAVSITVENAIVTLQGILPSKTAYERAVEIATVTNGVVDIQNRMRIR